MDAKLEDALLNSLMVSTSNHINLSWICALWYWKNRAILQPLSGIAFILSRSVMIITCLSYMKMLCIIYSVLWCRSVVTSGPLPGCPPQIFTSTISASRSLRRPCNHLHTVIFFY